ncbi:STAS domain-containing protein [Kitasatospora sp. McL0602]|uniref:STAS domain-containing protein n=1 Tax=Kitasatospora sp. McL0602 TaxID=3439530 RepID=UPI003F8AD9DC
MPRKPRKSHHRYRERPLVVAVHGSLDLASAPPLRRRLLTAVHGHPHVVVDLSQVSFMDCSGLAALAAARNHAQATGHRLVLRAPSTPVTRIMKLTGLRRRLTGEP